MMSLKRRAPSADAQRLAASSNSNAFVRDPLPGEVDELARIALPAGIDWPGSLPAPSADTVWRVLVIRGPKRSAIRMLTIQNAAAEEESPEQLVSTVPIFLGGRVAIAGPRG